MAQDKVNLVVLVVISGLAAAGGFQVGRWTTGSLRLPGHRASLLANAVRDPQGLYAPWAGASVAALAAATCHAGTAMVGMAGAQSASAGLFAALSDALAVGTLTLWASGVAALGVVDGMLKTVPSGQVGTLTAGTLALLMAGGLSSGRWRPVADGVLCAAVAVTGLSLWLLVAPARLGLGDVRMAALVGLGAGALAPVLSLTAMACSPAAAALWRRATDRSREGREAPWGSTPVALGPFLAVGGLSVLVGHGCH